MESIDVLLVCCQGGVRPQCGQQHSHPAGVAQTSPAHVPLSGVETGRTTKVIQSSSILILFHQGSNEVGVRQTSSDRLMLTDSFHFSLSPLSSYADEQGPKHWSDSRFIHVMELKQAALGAARRLWTDYILVRH